MGTAWKLLVYLSLQGLFYPTQASNRKSSSSCWKSSEGFDATKSVPSDPDDFFELFDRHGVDGILSTEEIGYMAKAVLPPTANYDPQGLSLFFNRSFPLSRYNFRTILWPFFTSRVGLFVIDVQNDFVNGTLTFPNAGDVIPPINRLVGYEGFYNVIYSMDWHPNNHISFYESLHQRREHVKEIMDGTIEEEALQPRDKVTFQGISHGPMEQILWPKHCVQGTWGAEFHEDLEVKNGSLIIHKGTNPLVESYSAFFDNVRYDPKGTGLLQKLRKEKIRVGVFTGLAMDYCVGLSVLDALSSGIPSIVVEEAVREISNETAALRLKEIVEQGGIVLKYADDIMELMDCFQMSGGEKALAINSALIIAPLLLRVLSN